MASLGDIGVSALINIISAFTFLLAFAVLRIQPINDRVYFPKWYIEGKRTSPRSWGGVVGKFVNLNIMTYFTFLNWMPQALKMSESEIITHAGLDSAVFLRIYTLGLKIFTPVAIVALLILIPVNVSDGTLSFLSRDLVVDDIDKLSISNVRPKSYKFFVHISMEYLFTFWVCYMLYKEYNRIASMRLKFLAAQGRRAEQFTVLVRNVPHVSGRSVSDSVETFFQRNHPDHYLCHQAMYNANKFARMVRQRNRLQNWLDYYQLKFERHPDKRPKTKRGCLGICGKKVDSIDYYKEQIKYLDKKLTMERQKILKDSKSVMPAAFVSFNSRWGAAVCAQTQQSKNPTLWLTNWAPEPRDVYWRNLAIPFVSLSIRKLVISLSVFALVFFYMIPIAFVQSLANLEGLERVAPFLRPLVEWGFIKSFLQGFLPPLALKLFLYFLPAILMIMSKIEGHVALSVLERRTAAKYYYFLLVNVFLGSIVAGTAFQQLHAFLHQSATQIPRNIGVSIPMKATFFITYIMTDGWAGIACEILRLKPLVIFHLKNMFIVKTERDLEKAMNPGGVDFPEALPSLQLYFLLGIVYMVVTPILLPFILIFFALAYFVYRHQIINVYHQQYESAAAFWPHVHARIIASLLISQLLLMGLLTTKKAANSTPLLIVLPVLTLSFHKYCKNRFEPAFRNYPLEEAMSKDTQDRASESEIDLKSYLADAYLHPIFRSFEEVDLVEVRVDTNPNPNPNPNPPKQASPSPTPSELSSPSPDHDHHDEDEPSHTVQHYEVRQPHPIYQYELEQPHHVYQYDHEQPHTAYHYEVESPSNVYRYDSEPHYQYYHY
ncbi:early-responsive to dehydration stress protein [Perilla frutescens var. hirtella]|uniref:Early-responsive to dehydration stress protein n=1 Tax=Perilla frutescens var. hirtella TaxID=608512 RepID=A0AAD4IS66_PERFH|nr:early-responsive to dehydration stress protein [Perilla frutescens var. hirtella]